MGYGSKRDNQRQRVYSFGWACKELPGNRSLDKHECQKLANRVARKYNTRAATLVFNGNRRTAYVNYCGDKIVLPNWAMNKVTLAHEVAHNVTSKLGHGLFADHGPEFVAIFIDIMVYIGVAKKSALKVIAKAKRVKVGRGEVNKKISCVKDDNWHNEVVKETEVLLTRVVDKYAAKYKITKAQVRRIIEKKVLTNEMV